MDPKKLEAVGQFLQQQGADDLFVYLKLDADAGPEAVGAALKKRRSWAQGQQSNPKYRTEAVWVIKNMSSLRHLLVDNLDTYRSHLSTARSLEALERFTPYVLGAIADGVLTRRAEAALTSRGVDLGLDEDTVFSHIETLLRRQGARRTAIGLASARTLAIMPEDRDELLQELAAVDAPTDPATSPRLRPTTQHTTPPAHGDTNADDDPTMSEAPPPPIGLRSSLQPGQPVEVTSHAPLLEIDAPPEQLVTVSSKPVSIKLTIRNIGFGKMAGKIHADRPWLTTSPSKLDPARATQVITLTIDPREMTRRRGQTRVTISTRSAGNRSFIIQVQRRRSMLPLAALGGVSIGALLFAASRVLFPGDPVLESRLLVRVDPPSGDIYVGDQLMTTQGVLDIRSGFPLGEPFPLQVKADGFEPWAQTITVTEGEMRVIKPELELVDLMDFTPRAEAEEGRLDEAKVNSAIQSRKTQFDRCFVSNVSGTADDVVILEVRGFVNQLGNVARLDFLERSYASEGLDWCLRRQFRALDLPMLNPRYDYAVFEYIFHYTVPPDGQ